METTEVNIKTKWVIDPEIDFWLNPAICIEELVRAENYR